MNIPNMCDQIILAANSVVVQGEGNMAQLLGICRAARAIKAETARQAESAKQEEVSGHGG